MKKVLGDLFCAFCLVIILLSGCGPDLRSNQPARTQIPLNLILPSQPATPTFPIPTLTPNRQNLAITATIQPTRTPLPTAGNLTDRWWTPLVVEEIWSVLEPLDVKFDPNGWVLIGQSDTMHRLIIVIDQSRSHDFRTQLILEITRHPTPAAARAASEDGKKEKERENFLDISTAAMDSFPAGSWLMQKDSSVVMLGSFTNRYEFVLYSEANLIGWNTNEPFTNFDEAVKIVLLAGQAEVDQIKKSAQ